MGKSIADYGGLKQFLDATKMLHNKLGYNDLIKRHEEYKGNVYRLAKEFGVTRPTIYNWLDMAGLEPNRLDKKSDRQIKQPDGQGWL